MALDQTVPTSPARSSRDVVDRALTELHAHRTEWARLPVLEKRALLEQIKDRAARLAPEWVEVATRIKRLPTGSPIAGEEWMSGPWALIAGIVGLSRTLERIARGRDPLEGARLHRAADGRVIVDVFPSSPFEQVLLSGYSASVWMQPGVDEREVRRSAGSFHRHVRDPIGSLALVLGAGNITSIAPLDVLYEMIAEGRVVVLKMSPVNEALGPVLERVMAPLVERGFLRFVYGGADVGEMLTRHRLVEKIHVTGSAATHDAIVFGTGDEGRARKQRREPLTQIPVTSELGGVGPVIVVPGVWSEADMRFQAEHVATQKLHNAGFNCVAAQVLVLHREWPLRERFLAILRDTIAQLPKRAAYYPGADARQRDAVEKHARSELLGGQDVPYTRIVDLDPDDRSAPAYRSEFFGATWAETSISAPDVQSFLARAVTFANERLMGTLGAQILVHPATQRAHRAAIERAITDLRYGTIAVNAWSGVGFLLANASWGAFPGHTLEDIQSGRGVVHNAMLLERTEKTVVRGPFAPFPRSLLLGERHTSPKPPWFVTHRRSDRVGALLTQFEAAPSWRKLPAIFAAALSG
ncbi:aldehyde dehydrogenase family protein [Sandaracinus amylolyticus]|nr:aldehyde dehydrogenase family protein [Sandaracinus amylolyticus]